MRLSQRQMAAMKHLDETGSLPADVKQRTVKSLIKRELIEPFENGYRRFQKEMIDNPSHQIRIVQRPFSTAPTVDIDQADYGWWEKAARGQVAGLRLAGPLLKPVK